MMSWYNAFVEQFEDGKEIKVKVAKPMMFKRFCKYILSQEKVNKTMLDLQNYVVKNNLMKGTVDYSNFNSYNQFLSMKQKKKDKLN